MIKFFKKFSIYNMPLWIVIKDIQNYIDWIKTIKKEKQDTSSIYNKLNMKHNFFYSIYFVMSLNEEDKALPDNIKRLRIIELLSPVHRYIDEDLQFAEYIVPEFNQFYDDEQPTLLYGIVYRFAFKRLSFKFILSRTLFLSILIWLFMKYQMMSYILNFIK